MTDLNKAIALAEKANEQLQKSHVKQYTRSDGTVVQEHEDSRQAAHQASAEAKATSLSDKAAHLEAHKKANEAHHKAYLSAHSLMDYHRGEYYKHKSKEDDRYHASEEEKYRNQSHEHFEQTHFHHNKMYDHHKAYGIKPSRLV